MTGHKDSFEVQRLDVVNTGRRRRWSFEEKLRIVEESYQGYRQVSATARRHDISPSLLYAWRKALGSGWDSGGDVAVGFSRAVIVLDGQACASGAGGRMEVVTARGERIIVAGDVDAGAFARILAVLEARR